MAAIELLSFGEMGLVVRDPSSSYYFVQFELLGEGKGDSGSFGCSC